MRGDADQVADVRNRRSNISLAINPLKTAKINDTRFGRIENALGKGCIGFGSLATRCDQDSHSVLSWVVHTGNKAPHINSNTII